MSLDFSKIDASLFAIEGFLARLKSHGDNLEHLNFYMVMTSELRKIIKNNRPSVVVPLSRPDEPETTRRVRGPMSEEQKKKISNTIKRLNRQKKLVEKKIWVRDYPPAQGVIKKKFSLRHRKNISKAQKRRWANKPANVKKGKR